MFYFHWNFEPSIRSLGSLVNHSIFDIFLLFKLRDIVLLPACVSVKERERAAKRETDSFDCDAGCVLVFRHGGHFIRHQRQAAPCCFDSASILSTRDPEFPYPWLPNAHIYIWALPQNYAAGTSRWISTVKS